MRGLALALVFLLGSFHGSSAQPTLSDANITSLLDDLRSKGFFTGATIVSLVVTKSNQLAPGITLLVPTDRALAQNVSTTDSTALEALIKFHILETDFNFTQLSSLPVGTWIPTALPSYGVEVTSDSPSNFSLNNAQVVDDDICPSMATLRIACQGLSDVLNLSSTLSTEPHNPPFESTAPSPFPSPMASPPSASTFLSPSSSSTPLASPSPLASEPTSAPTFFSPSSSSSASPSSSPSPSPFESPSPSPFSHVPIFQAPIASPISPSSPFETPPFEGAPGPSEVGPGNPTSSAVASRIGTPAIATLCAIMLALIKM